jgi:hypothetical protein
MLHIYLTLIQGKATGVAATTGTAALLCNGKTIHSLLNFRGLEPPIFGPNDNVQQYINSFQYILIDEISMMTKELLLSINNIFRDACMDEEEKKRPFAGKSLIILGDLRQLPPILNESEILIGEEKRKLNMIFDQKKMPYLFQLFEPLYLEENVRQKGDLDLQNTLNEVADAKVSQKGWDIIESFICKHCKTIENSKGIFNFNISDCPIFRKGEAIILVSTHNERYEINEKIMSQINEGEKLIELEPYFTLPTDSTKITAQNEKDLYFAIQEEVKKKFGKDAKKKPKFPLHLSLKPGVPGKPGTRLICLQNISISQGLSNGSLITFVSESENKQYIKVCLKDDTKLESQLFIRRFAISFNVHFKNQLKCIQIHLYPVDLGYCLTIHKAQGQTYPQGILLFPHYIFSFGQLYTGLSRCQTRDQIHIAPISIEDIKAKIINDPSIEECLRFAKRKYEVLKYMIDSDKINYPPFTKEYLFKRSEEEKILMHSERIEEEEKKLEEEKIREERKIEEIPLDSINIGMDIMEVVEPELDEDDDHFMEIPDNELNEEKLNEEIENEYQIDEVDFPIPSKKKKHVIHLPKPLAIPPSDIE